MSIEDATHRDPLLHLAGSWDNPGRYIEEMEAAGSNQLVHANLLPTEAHGHEDELAALGIHLGPIDERDPLFREAVLPAGWSKQPGEDPRLIYVNDEHGRTRLHVFYKAAFYDRQADVTVVPLDCDTESLENADGE
ncbi:hypothetical protein [Actinocrispum wychmicini]|uniref:Uncharacterized protein n=1 Tax=Actinocrispum wychmicini TaxID=1213861 RepID=A0A4R2JFY8_9PSEU|nr:hypothetical protein [Actinocrispum wychmicini]TCO57172.1 hypothetical protein EV192_106649 [Actinocrispum wychmicini]